MLYVISMNYITGEQDACSSTLGSYNFRGSMASEIPFTKAYSLTGLFEVFICFATFMFIKRKSLSNFLVREPPKLQLAKWPSKSGGKSRMCTLVTQHFGIVNAFCSKTSFKVCFFRLEVLPLVHFLLLSAFQYFSLFSLIYYFIWNQFTLIVHSLIAPRVQIECEFIQSFSSYHWHQPSPNKWRLKAQMSEPYNGKESEDDSSSHKTTGYVFLFFLFLSAFRKTTPTQLSSLISLLDD